MEKLPEQITPESLYPSSQQEPRKSKDAVTFAWNILHLVDPDHSSRSSSTSFFEAAISSSPRNKKTDTQEGEITYPRSPSWEWQSWNSNSDLPGSGSLPPPSAHPPRTAAEARDCRAESQLPRACKFLFSSLNRCLWPKLGMGRPVMMTLENKDLKGFTWAIAPALTSLGYLLILLVSIFPFWVRLVNEESHEVFFSGLFENCFHIKCWKPRPLSVYIILGRVFLLSAVVLSFLTTFVLVSFASQLFPRTWRHNLVSAFISFLTGVCAFLALLLHALEIQNLRMKPSPPQFSVQWPYYVLGFAIVLFIVAGICICSCLMLVCTTSQGSQQVPSASSKKQPTLAAIGCPVPGGVSRRPRASPTWRIWRVWEET
ncbi:transmembrane protein 225B isoform X1 [Mustela putorius furo]|uniref:Transmembrane protein 225B isoform X1 n=1 Tax=Mustela putorius furo TaxID=9669 RepID=A0A8U0RWY9_MUSPF|nr:transmembrane protein 225B isoform X1 [Mustela putorius furo]